jgi:putative ABC transport system substrate-binding protein
MRRREFLAGIAGVAATRPVPVLAQSAPVPVIGFLGSASPEQWTRRTQAFLNGLGEAGFVEGSTVSVEYRWAHGSNERLPSLAANLVERGVTAIVVLGTTASAVAARNATTKIPIVIRVAANPVELGLVASMREPGGNITGVTTLGAEAGPKQLELLHELVPAARRFALLINPTNPVLAAVQTRDLPAFAGRLGLKLDIVTAGAEADFGPAFAQLSNANVGGLMIAADTFFNNRNQQIAVLAARYALPSISPYREYPEAGGLMSYGGSIAEASREVGLYMGRILKGENPATLPVQQIAKLELSINLRAAKGLGLEIPPALLARADEVIE